jgi:hypothetical protein
MPAVSKNKARTATHRPAGRRRTFRHDDLIRGASEKRVPKQVAA